MSESSETTILQDGPVKITNRRALIGTLSYSLTEIRSVLVTKRARSIRSLWLVVGGAFLIFWSVIDQTGYYGGFFNIGTVLVILGLALVFFGKPTFALQVKGPAGEDSILRSTNLPYIERIAGAMEKAIAGKGETI
jgi:hypothetical protein